MKKIILTSLFATIASLSIASANSNNLTLPVLANSNSMQVASLTAQASDLFSPNFINSLVLKDNYLNSIKPKAEFSDYVTGLVQAAEKTHYSRINLLKPEYRTKALSIYLELLDPNKALFTQKEVQEYKNLYTAGNKTGFITDINAYAKIYSDFAKKAVDNFRYMAVYVQGLKEQPNLNLNQTFTRPKYTDYLATEQQIKDFSKIRVINDIINIKLDKPNFTWQQIRERLLKAYRYRVKSINTLTDAEVFNVYTRALTFALDTHSEYSTPDQISEIEESLSSTFDGIGVQIKLSDDGIVSFPAILDNGPAKKEGTLSPKDELLAVSPDGKNWEEIDGYSLNRITKLIKGPRGTDVWLRVMDVNGKIKELKITRGPVNKENVSARIEVFTNDKGEKYAILKFGQFYTNLAQDIVKAFKEHDENFDGVIVDIRNNGGGLVSELLHMSSVFISPLHNIFQISNSDSQTQGQAQLSRSVYGSKLKYDGPLIVMINGNSASASEIFAAAVQDWNRGVVLGATSFGKGTVQSYNGVNGGFNGVLKTTIQKFYRINGSTTQFKGVTPDISLPDTKTDVFDEANSINPLAYSTIKSATYKPFVGYVTPQILAALEKAKTEYIAANPDVQKYNSYLVAQKNEAKSKTYKINYNFQKELTSGLRDFILDKYNIVAKKEGKPTITNIEEADNTILEKVDLQLDIAKQLIQVYASEYAKSKK